MKETRVLQVRINHYFKCDVINGKFLLTFEKGSNSAELLLRLDLATICKVSQNRERTAVSRSQLEAFAIVKP